MISDHQAAEQNNLSYLKEKDVDGMLIGLIHETGNARRQEGMLNPLITACPLIKLNKMMWCKFK